MGWDHLQRFATVLVRRPGVLPPHFWSAFLGEAGSLTVGVAIVVVWRVRASQRARARRDHDRRTASAPFDLDEGIDDLQRIATELDPHEVSRN